MTETAAAQVSTDVRVASVMYVVMGLGFGVTTAASLNHFSRHGELPLTPFGFRALSGPFESLPAGVFAAAGWMLVSVCALDVATGIWLWRGSRRGAIVGMATSPTAFALSIGFALPFLLIGVPIRAALAWAGRHSLR